MKLTERIVAERITALSQLTAAEQAAVRADPALGRLIEENRALAALGPQAPAPARQAMLAGTYRAATETKEHSMSLLARTFAGKKWYAQAALAAVLVLAFAVIAIVVPHEQSWAKTEGFMLVYDLGTIAEQPPHGPGDHPVLNALQDAVRAWGEQRDEDGAAEPVKVAISVKIENEHVQVFLGVLNSDEDWLESLKAALADVPGLPAPTVQPATWFLDPENFDPAGGLTLKVDDHHFSFPPGASEEEIEATITEWLAEQHPGTPVEVDVTIHDEGEERRLEVKVMLKETDGE